MNVRTVGHGAHPQESWSACCRMPAWMRWSTSAGAAAAATQFTRDAMSGWLPRPTSPTAGRPSWGDDARPREDSPHLALRNDSFRAYADHMETEPFTAALDDVVREASGSAVAVLCAEGLWWNCHRRLLADALVLRQEIRVEHLLPDGRIAARADRGRAPDGDRLVYDVGIHPAAQRSVRPGCSVEGPGLAAPAAALRGDHGR